MRSFLLAIFLFGSYVAYSQETNYKVITGKTFTSVDLFLLLSKFQHSPEAGFVGIQFSKCTFFHGSKEYMLESLYESYPEWDSNEEPFDPILKVKFFFPISFTQCHFNPGENQPFILSNLYLTFLEFNNCTGYGLEFQDCITYSRIQFIDPDFKYLTFENHRFFEAMELNDARIERLEIRHSAFIGNKKSRSFGLNFQNRNSISLFFIEDSEFIDASKDVDKYRSFDRLIHDIGVVRFEKFDTDMFLARRNYFDCSVLFNDFTVGKDFSFDNRLLREIIFESVPTLPTESSVIPYRQFLQTDAGERNHDPLGSEQRLKNKIGITLQLPMGENQFVRFDNKEDFKRDLEKPWANNDPEKRIIPVYSRLLAIYDANNDLDSYNRCFNDLKEVEKTASEVRWDTHGRFKDKFRWKMDEFLQDFSAYGTDPVLSLINGFWTILIFAGLYAFFPSEDDNLTLQRIKQAFQKYIQHFGKGQKEFYTPDELYDREIKEIANLKTEIFRYHRQMPPVIRIFSLPIYYSTKLVAMAKHRARQMVHFSIYDDWQLMSQRRRIRTTIVLTLSLIVFSLWGLFMRCLNAVTLSMNAFVTLGYGEIEAKGAARYFCVLEGIVGWFLLSIFSVSLISQILQ